MTLDTALHFAAEYCGCDYKKTPIICYYADVAQKELACFAAAIVKRYEIKKETVKEKAFALPDDYLSLHNIMRRNSALPVNYRVDGENLIIKDYGIIDVYYKAMPKTVTAKTAGSYVFEIDKKLHIAIPYYIAYRMAENYDVSQNCFDEWNKIISLYKMTKPKEIKFKF